MNIVFDTNVLISAHIFKGNAARVYDYCVLNHSCFISPFIRNELSEKLISKFEFNSEELAEVLSLINERIVNVLPTNQIPVAVERDPDDNHILQLAEFIKADFIITGDKDLLVLKSYYSIAIISPAAAIDLFKIHD